jgi:hypothetical protein
VVWGFRRRLHFLFAYAQLDLFRALGLKVFFSMMLSFAAVGAFLLIGGFAFVAK